MDGELGDVIVFSERLIKNILESMDDAVFITDFSTRILWHNNAVSQVMENGGKRVLGFKLSEIFKKTDTGVEWDNYLEKLSSGDQVCQFRHVLKGRHYEIRGAVIKEPEQGKLIFWRWKDMTGQALSDLMAGHLRDILGAIRKVGHIITKEKDPKKLIEKVCKSLFESGGSGYAWAILFDEKGKPVYSVESGLGERFLHLREYIERGEVPACAGKTLRSSDPVVLQRSSCLSFDCPLAKTDESWNGGVSMKLDYEGRMWGVLTVCRTSEIKVTGEELELLRSVAEDVSFAFHGLNIEVEKKKSLEVLAKTENMFRLLVEHSLFGLAIMGPDKTFEYLNPRFSEITGYTLTDIPDSESWLKLAFPDRRDRHRMMSSWKKGWSENLEPGSTNEGTFKVKCKDHSYKVLRFRSIILDDGRIIYSCEDITEKENLRLQLLQSQKMEAIGRLAGGIAHDFNNLLTTILGMVDLLLMNFDESDPRTRDLLEVKKAARRASLLTKQLLAFSRRQVLQPTILDLNTVVREMSKMLRRLIGEDIELVTVLDENLGYVKVDQSQIEQVIMNLAVNARDAMPEGGKLTIETANVELDEEYARRHVGVKPGSYVMLAITDTGFGMDEKTSSRIFEPFFTTKEKDKGTGLGLATVYGIVKQSGGNIWVYSEPGKGTTFKIYLPRVAETKRSSTAETAREDNLQGSETILVVEDDDMVRNLTCKILSGAGYRVLNGASGEEAVRIAQEHGDEIDLVITDVVMPRMSGKELARKLKEIGLEAKTLYISGYTDNAIVKHGILEEGIEFIQKPFSLKTLLKKVRDVLG